jgi:DNA-binding NarL/FixJ family response regulator
MHAEEEVGVRALMAGADGYLTKDRAREDLASAVRRCYSDVDISARDWFISWQRFLTGNQLIGI